MSSPYPDICKAFRILMKILSLKGYRSAIGIRMIVQFAALALVPIGALAAMLATQATLSPQLESTLLSVAGAAGLIALGLAVVQSELIVRRLDSLTLSTRRIAKQDFSATVPVAGTDEVAKLANAINAMARHLDASLSAQQILAQMDDAILTKLDVGALIRSARTPPTRCASSSSAKASATASPARSSKSPPNSSAGCR
jgi:HAMP domain-containing protein